ncbi:MAG: transposase, partial [Zoogloeaceae bacterium]|nr:transposase [Zoogloeaceae bacterium]
ERFHRTFKAEVLAQRHFETLAQAQAQFDGWRGIHNRERPHEALSMPTPCSQPAQPARRLAAHRAWLRRSGAQGSARGMDQLQGASGPRPQSTGRTAHRPSAQPRSGRHIQALLLPSSFRFPRLERIGCPIIC